MPEERDRPVRTRELIMATPVTVAGKVVQPIVRLDGWWQASGSGAGALVRLSPDSIQVQDGKRTYSVPITDPTSATLRTFFYLGGAISAGCILLMLLVRLATRRR